MAPGHEQQKLEKPVVFAVNRNPDAAELRKFGLAMLIGFFGLAALVAISMVVQGVSAWRVALSAGLAVVGACLFLLSYGRPRIAKPVYVGWMSVVMPVGVVMSTVLLTVLYVVLLPIFSIVVRAGDPLRKKKTTGKTYWEDYRPDEPTLERMRRPF